jgi:hypothetical protein
LTLPKFVNGVFACGLFGWWENVGEGKKLNIWIFGVLGLFEKWKTTLKLSCLWKIEKSHFFSFFLFFPSLQFLSSQT